MPRTLSLVTSLRSVLRASPEQAKDEESEIEGIELGQPCCQEVVVEPLDIYQCNNNCRHITNREVLILARSDGGLTIKVVVGSAPNRTTFKIPKSLLCRHADYFSVALKDGNEDRFVEADKGEFHWPDDDAEEFHRFVRWMYSCSSCRLGDAYNSLHVCKKDGELDADPYSWCHPDVEAEQAFVLGDRILSAEYCRFALGSFIQHVHRIDPRRIIWVLENTADRSSLHRFVRAWLGWLKFKLDKRLVSADEEDDAAVYSELFVSFDGWLTTDPRKYLMEHWLEPCSLDPNLYCGHKRAHWFWCRTASGMPGCPPPRETRPRTRGEIIWEGSLGVWYGCSIVMLVLAAYIFARDREGLISHSSKALSVVTSCFAFVGMCTCGSWVPLVSTPTVLVAFASAILASREAARCFQGLMDELDCHNRYLDMQGPGGNGRGRDGLYSRVVRH
ncbi:hypothetical protein CONLIGDRAFT_649711 [Coniochaeta ligniaria NRRL 30616]|uniref:BTB domain-containing protein n=1 Tax=Coniochaeta ligniaria NRRL 30616 TaxID=1408157 RepID=A0A1J7I888_9PEZI|nr:hypothetical protein CONLIGDRAFT_649711 [Coniochaeta ligniaria NRRL 30616]